MPHINFYVFNPPSTSNYSYISHFYFTYFSSETHHLSLTYSCISFHYLSFTLHIVANYLTKI